MAISNAEIYQKGNDKPGYSGGPYPCWGFVNYAWSPSKEDTKMVSVFSNRESSEYTQEPCIWNPNPEAFADFLSTLSDMYPDDPKENHLDTAIEYIKNKSVTVDLQKFTNIYNFAKCTMVRYLYEYPAGYTNYCMYREHTKFTPYECLVFVHSTYAPFTGYAPRSGHCLAYDGNVVPTSPSAPAAKYSKNKWGSGEKFNTGLFDLFSRITKSVALNYREIIPPKCTKESLQIFEKLWRNRISYSAPITKELVTTLSKDLNTELKEGKSA